MTTGFRVTSQATAAFPLIQSQIFELDTAIMAGTTGNVVSGCAVTAQSTPDMTVHVAAGSVVPLDMPQVDVAADDLAVDAAHATLFRIDLVSASTSGVATYTAGTAAALASLEPPARPAGHVVLAFVAVSPTATQIDQEAITDKRRLSVSSARTWVNVQDYGALGDDTTDDTAAIQAAIDATPEAGICFFPTTGSKYKITAALNIGARRIHIVGEGAGSIVRQAAANTDGFVSTLDILGSFSSGGPDNNRNYDRASSLTNVRIEGPTGGSAGAGIYGLSDINLLGVETYGFNIGFFLDWRSYYARAIGCKFARASHAALLHKGYNFTAFNCQFWNSAFGVWISGNQNMRFRDCVFEQNSSAGLYSDGALQGSLTDPASTLLVSGCYFEEVTSGTPDVHIGATTAVADVTIEDCHFVKNAQGDTGASWHIDADRATALTISTNRLYGGGTGGGDIRCTANTEGVVLINQFDAITTGLPAATVYLDQDHLPVVDPTTTEGDLLYRASGVLTRLALGASGRVLASTGSAPSWTVVGGDVTGAIPALTVAKLQGRAMSSAAPSDGQAVVWDAGGSTWKPADPAVILGHVHIVDEVFSGDASTTVFPLANEAEPETVIAYVSGTRTTVTLGGTLNDEITFASAPASGTNNISVDYAAVAA